MSKLFLPAEQVGKNTAKLSIHSMRGLKDGDVFGRTGISARLRL
jgi:hypothetical protein